MAYIIYYYKYNSDILFIYHIYGIKSPKMSYDDFTEAIQEAEDLIKQAREAATKGPSF